MTTRLARWIVLGAMVALLQSGVLVGMVYKHAAILRDGAEITLFTEPVDPHDLFRGDYVDLNYPISTVDSASVTGVHPATDGPVDLYVVLKQGADGIAAIDRANWQKQHDLAPGEIQLRGRTVSYVNAAPHSPLRVSYGIERYYVPEGQGRTIEEEQRKQKLKAVIAISASGEAQIKAVKLGDQVLYEEPIY